MIPSPPTRSNKPLEYFHVFRGNQPKGRKGQRCRLLDGWQGNIARIEFEDGVQFVANRANVRRSPKHKFAAAIEAAQLRPAEQARA